MDHLDNCNRLTNFKTRDAHAITGNGSYVNLKKLVRIFLRNQSLQVNLFSVGFSNLELVWLVLLYCTVAA